MIKSALDRGFIDTCVKYGITDANKIDGLMKAANQMVANIQKQAAVDLAMIKQQLGPEVVQQIMAGQIDENALAQMGISPEDAAEIINAIRSGM